MIGLRDDGPARQDPIRVQMQGGQDFTIPAPQPTPQGATPPMEPAPARTTAPSPFSRLERMSTTPELLLGAAALLVLAIVFCSSGTRCGSI